MKMSSTDQQAIARRAIFYFDCYFGMPSEDSSVFTGDGVDDLDALISRLTNAYATGSVGVKSRFLCDVGTQYSDWRAFDIQDLQAIRGYYVAYYGNVNKPAVKERTDLSDGTVAVQL